MERTERWSSIGLGVVSLIAGLGGLAAGIVGAGGPVGPIFTALVVFLSLVGLAVGIFARNSTAGCLGLILSMISLVSAAALIVDELFQRNPAFQQTQSAMRVIMTAMDAYKDADPHNEYPPDHDVGWPNAEPPMFVNGKVNQDSTYQPGDGIYVLWMYLTGQHYADSTFNVATMRDLSADPAVRSEGQACIAPQ